MNSDLLPIQSVIERIVVIRGQKVLLDADLATLYGVETRRLNEQVRRNSSRFPPDFKFELTAAEFASLKSHFATSSWGGRRKVPSVFTEHGAIMAASILNSTRAIEVSVFVVRAFVQLRDLAGSNAELARRLDEVERRVETLSFAQDNFEQSTRHQLKHIVDTLKQMMAKPVPPKNRPIGFITPDDDPAKAESGLDPKTKE